MSDVALPFADCVEPYLPAVGASLPQILPQINLYPHPPLRCRSPISFPLFSYDSPAPAEMQFLQGFSPAKGEQVIWGDHQPIGQLPAQFCVALGFMMHLVQI